MVENAHEHINISISFACVYQETGFDRHKKKLWLNGMCKKCFCFCLEELNYFLRSVHLPNRPANEYNDRSNSNARASEFRCD